MKHDDCKALLSLMQNGFSFPDAIEIIRDKRNTKLLDKILRHLVNGERISTFLTAYCPKEIRSYFSAFLKYMNITDSLAVSLDLYEHEKKERDALMKGMLYPLMLLFASLTGVLFFNQLILPSMLSLMQSFHQNTDVYLWICSMMGTGSVFLLVTAAICAILLLLFTRKERIVETYCFITKYVPHSLLTERASRQFAVGFLEGIRRNPSTRMNLEILGALKEKPLVCFIAKELDRTLNEGEQMEQAVKSPYVEELLQHFFRLAVYSSDAAGMLEEYLRITEIRTRKRIRHFTEGVQFFSYFTIGCVIVFVYQILMLPMQILQNI